MERELSCIGDFNAAIDYCEMFASFVGEFVDLRTGCPDPEILGPDPSTSYPLANVFADAVQTSGYYGIVYPSVRKRGGVCLVALMPHAVQSVAQGNVISVKWSGKPEPHITTHEA
jgi:hypothetical protein